MDDTELVELLRHDETRALEAAVGRYERLAYWTAFAIVGVHADAEEVAADAFVLLWRRRHEVELRDASLAPWVVAAARFLAQNRLRSMRRRPPVALTVNTDVPWEGSVEGEAERAELRVALRQVVAALSEVDRGIFVLCLEEGLSYEAAATSLGLPHGTVRNRLSRLRRRLRRSLTTLLEES